MTALSEDAATLAVDPFEYEVLIPEFTRRQIQSEIGQEISLHTIDYIDGNIQKGGRMSPRLIGFNSEIEREFFEVFCSVPTVGVKKALRAMVRPIPDVARAIEQQDVKTISTLPGIGPTTAEKIVAGIRRKMPKFALIVAGETGTLEADVEHDIVEDTYQILVALGHGEFEARKMLEVPLTNKKKFKDVEALLQAVYEQANSSV